MTWCKCSSVVRCLNMWAFSGIFLFVLQEKAQFSAHSSPVVLFISPSPWDHHGWAAASSKDLVSAQNTTVGSGMQEGGVCSGTSWNGQSGQLLSMALCLSEGLINMRAAAVLFSTGMRYFKTLFLSWEPLNIHRGGRIISCTPVYHHPASTIICIWTILFHLQPAPQLSLHSPTPPLTRLLF